MKRLREKLLGCLGLGLLLITSHTPSTRAQSVTPPNPAVPKQLFPGRTIGPDQLPQYRNIQLDLNGDKIKEWIVVYNPNPVKKKKKRKGCLCPKPKPQGDKTTVKRIGKVKNTLNKYEDYLYAIKLTGPKRRKVLEVWYQLAKKPKIKESDLGYQIFRRIGRRLKRRKSWRKWRVRRVKLVNVDNGTTYELSSWRTKKMANSAYRRRMKLFKRWYKQTGMTDIPLCKCPKKKPKKIVYKQLVVVVATEVPPAKTAPTDSPKIPTPSDTPTGPKVVEVGRLRADNVEIRPLTKDNNIFALVLEDTSKIGTLRKQTQSLYTYNQSGKRLKKVLGLVTSQEGSETDPDGRTWSRLKFQNMDSDAWLEIIVDSYYETPNFNGSIKRTMFKWDNGAYKPLNKARGILKITTSSTWRRVAPKGTRMEQIRLNTRTLPQNLMDGFRDTIWAGNKRGRGIGEWIRVQFMKRRPLLGIAVSAKKPTLLKHVEDNMYPGGEAKAPKLAAPTYLRIQTADAKRYDFAVKPGRRYTFFRFPKTIRTAFFRLQVVKEFRDPNTGKVTRLNVSNKEQTITFLSEIVPVFDEVHYTASSFESRAADQYLPAYAGDSKDLTAWAEGRKDSGIGEWIQLLLPIPKQISAISIVNGCRRPGERYILNGRIKQAQLNFSNGTTQTINIKDTNKRQTVKIRPVRTSYVRLTIREVYKGKLGAMTCLTQFSPQP